MERDESSHLDRDLPGAFLDEMRAAVLDARRPASHRIIAIAHNAAFRTRLVELLREQVVEQDFREAVSEYLEDTADGLESKVDASDTVVELFDRAVLPVAIAAFLSGLVFS